MKRVYIALGSNSGDREGFILKAIELVKSFSRLIQSSSMYKNESQEKNVGQDYFINAVIEIETKLNPLELLKALREIESLLGRDPTEKGQHQPRTIDLDIVDYSQETMEVEELILPHPRMHLRSFVLNPLQEINPDWHHPLTHEGVQALLSKMNQ